jgi:hypothetical protein
LLLGAALGLFVTFLDHACAAQPASPGELCRAAILGAEREARIPPDLLGAIARVESARTDPASGAIVSWPWTVNAEGEGRFFASQSEAVAAVRDLMGRGIRVIDVGCLQVNLFYHADAFASIEEAFDPKANARYAARFLKRLQATSGDWITAAGHYHSTTLERAEPYRTRVLANWPAGQATILATRRAAEQQERLAQARPGGRSDADRRDLMAEAWARTRGPAAMPDATSTNPMMRFTSASLR